jgi:hypothetical protein
MSRNEPLPLLDIIMKVFWCVEWRRDNLGLAWWWKRLRPATELLAITIPRSKACSLDCTLATLLFFTVEVIRKQITLHSV